MDSNKRRLLVVVTDDVLSRVGLAALQRRKDH